MLKQIVSVILIILLSVGIILAMPHVQQGLEMLLAGYQWIADALTEIFSGGPAGNLIRNVIALLVIPFVAAIIPSIMYWFIKRHGFPYFMQIVWIIWIIQTAALVIQYKA